MIAGGAAVIGFGASALNTRATLRSNRRDARDERLWDKKTALYEDMYALGGRVSDLLDRMYQVADGYRQKTELSDYQPEIEAATEALHGLQPRTDLYASDPVAYHAELLRSGLTIWFQLNPGWQAQTEAGLRRALGNVKPSQVDLMQEMRLDLQQRKRPVTLKMRLAMLRQHLGRRSRIRIVALQPDPVGSDASERGTDAPDAARLPASS